MYRDGTGYEYTFSKNTLGGPKVMAKFPVSLEATRPGPYGCQIDVTKIADGSHRFYVEQEGKSAKWKLALPGEQKGARLKCTVKESLRLALCEPGYTPEEMQSPAD